MLKALKHIISLSFLPSQWLSHAMFCVLLVAQLVYVKFPAKPPYEEIRESIDSNVVRQSRQNGIDVYDGLDMFRLVDESYYRGVKVLPDVYMMGWEFNHDIEVYKASAKVFPMSDSSLLVLYTVLDTIYKKLINSVSEDRREALGNVMPINKYLFKNEYNDSRLNAFKKLFEQSNVNEQKTLLSLIQLDVLYSVAYVINIVILEHMPSSCGFSPVRVMSVPIFRNVYPGGKVKALLFIGARNPYRNETITVLNEGKISMDGSFREYWNDKATYVGMHSVRGFVCLNGYRNVITEPWSFQYLVLEKGISLQGDKMNTLYTGVPNPVTISVPGYPLSALSLRVPGASVAKLSDGHYTISVPQKNKDVLYGYIDARNTKGTVSTVHGMELHVKELPPPVATIAGVAAGDELPLVQMLKAHSISIAQRDTEMDMEYNLRSYQIGFITRNRTYYTGSYTIQGDDWNTIRELKEILQQLQPGDRVIVSDIEATDSRGISVDVPPVSYTIR